MTGCWNWLGAIDPKGYGRIRFYGKTYLAHRVAFWLCWGRWPEDCACHSCDNSSCVNPRHIFEGSRADNNRDMTRKGRHGCAKLTAEQVAAIREDARTQVQIAAEYGITQAQVSNILTHKSWKERR